MSGSFLPEPSWLVWHHQAYSGRGAGIVMESISRFEPQSGILSVMAMFQ
jgi:hypothetical protein